LSKVAIEGNSSGTGTFTIASPNSNSNRTLNLPDNAGTFITTGSTTGIDASALSTGTVAAARLPAGSILQVLTAKDTSFRSTTSSTFVTGSNTASVTITPASASNKIYVTCSGNASCNDGNDGWCVTIFRGATNLGNASSGMASGNSVPGVSATFFPFCMTILDSPNTTSATTYELRMKVIDVDGDGGTLRLGNYVSGDSDPIPTSITVFEVAA